MAAEYMPGSPSRPADEAIDLTSPSLAESQVMISPHRFVTVLSVILASVVGATYTAAQSDPPLVTSARDAQALGGLLPDIIEEVPQHLSVQNSHQREFLRFSTTHWNFGDGPLQVRGGGQEAACVVEGISTVCTFAMQEILDASGRIVAVHPAGVALFHPEHNHWHQSEVATFAVREALDGPPVGSTQLKTTYCLIDLDKSDLVHVNKTKVYWDCDAVLQGISVGYGDAYHHSTEGQELDITGLETGVYYLTFDADPAHHWLETDDTNNRGWARFRLDRKGANASVTVLETFGDPGNTSNK
jgi:hypothetical protein